MKDSSENNLSMEHAVNTYLGSTAVTRPPTYGNHFRQSNARPRAKTNTAPDPMPSKTHKSVAYKDAQENTDLFLIQ